MSFSASVWRATSHRDALDRHPVPVHQVAGLPPQPAHVGVIFIAAELQQHVRSLALIIAVAARALADDLDLGQSASQESDDPADDHG